MKYEIKLKFLDDILVTLYNSGAHKLNFNEINRSIYREDYEDKPDGIKRTFIAFVDPSNELGNAVSYLENEGYISFKDPFVYLNYKGILKLAKGGFVQEYIDRNDYRNLVIEVHKSTKSRNKYYMIFSALALIISIIALFVKVCK